MSTLFQLQRRHIATGFRLLFGALVLTLLFGLASQVVAPISASPLPPQHTALVAPNTLGLISFKVHAKKKLVDIDWTTGNEATIVGFYIWRRVPKGEYQRLNSEMIAAENVGEIAGNTYSRTDSRVKRGKVYFYELEVVNADGTSSWTDPVRVKVKQ